MFHLVYYYLPYICCHQIHRLLCRVC